MKAIATHAPEINALATNTQQQIINNENILSNKDAPGEDLTRSLEQFDAFAAKMKNDHSDTHSRIQRLCACSDRSFAFYDTVVENAANENIMLHAQKLTSSALDRIDTLKQVFGNSFLCDEVETSATSD